MVAHHMDPNEYMKDNDVAIGDPYLRFNKWIKRTWWHRWNHILTVVIMPIGPYRWVVSEFSLMLTGVVGNVSFYVDRYDFFRLCFWKLFWLVRMIIVPVYLHGLSGLIPLVICCFFLAEYMENIFIVNHIQSELEPPKGGHWAVKQAFATSNWGSGSKFWNWFSGGLNHQIEHHMFPGVSHYLYPVISPIVKQTCREFGIPYFNFDHFGQAFKGMVRHLEILGYDENDPKKPAPELPQNLALKDISNNKSD